MRFLIVSEEQAALISQLLGDALAYRRVDPRCRACPRDSLCAGHAAGVDLSVRYLGLARYLRIRPANHKEQRT